MASKVYGDIENCHVVGGSLVSTGWACGAIVGMHNSGNIKGCTVDGVSVEADGGVGGIVGVINENGGTRSITNCKVTNSTIKNKDTGDVYTDAAIAGMVNIENTDKSKVVNTYSVVNFTNCKVSGCNVDDIYDYVEDSNIVVVDGKATGYAFTKEALQLLLDVERYSDLAILLEKDITGDVTITQKQGINVSILGQSHSYIGSMIIDGQSKSQNTETLTIDNIKFYTESTANMDFIHGALAASNKYITYPHNVTIQNCSFESKNTTGSIVGVRATQWYNTKLLNCTVGNNMHSVVQGSGGGNGLLIEDVTGTCLEGCFNLGTIPSITVKNVDVTAQGDYGYGIRVDANTAVTPTLNVENSKLSSDSPIILRKSTDKTTYTINLTGDNTLTTTKANEYQIIATGASTWNASTPLAKPTGNVTITGADGMKIYK